MIKLNDNNNQYNTIVSIVNGRSTINQTDKITGQENTVILKSDQLQAAGIKIS
jgi:hypothetical protein